MLEYIASRDRANTEKYSSLLRGPEPGEISVQAQTYTGPGYRTVYTVFCDTEKATLKWCAQFAEKAAEETGEEIARVQVNKENGETVVYWPLQNCLRVYQKSGSGVDCIYENNNGTICGDVVALMDSGCGNPYIF